MINQGEANDMNNNTSMQQQEQQPAQASSRAKVFSGENPMNMATQLVIGSRVYSGLYGGRHGVVYAIHGEQNIGSTSRVLGGCMVTGSACYLDVVFENGTQSKRLPECIVKGVQWCLVEGVASAEEIQMLLDNAEETARLADIERTEQASAFARAVEAWRTNVDSAHLQQGDDDASGKLVAVNVRKELKKAFPGVKFSVRNPDFGTVNVRWEDGPTMDAVEAIVSKYENGKFNGMEDIYEYNVQPFHKVFGGTRYIFTSREFSQAHIQKAIDTLVTKYAGNFRDIEVPTAEQYSRGMLYRTTLPGFYDDLGTLIRREAGKL